jgi:hypothetical protein
VSEEVAIVESISRAVSQQRLVGAMVRLGPAEGEAEWRREEDLIRGTRHHVRNVRTVTGSMTAIRGERG